MFFINALPETGDSKRFDFEAQELATARFAELKGTRTYVVIELWRDGNPGASSRELRYPKLLDAWDADEGDLNPEDFCKQPNPQEALAWLNNAQVVSV